MFRRHDIIFCFHTDIKFDDDYCLHYNNYVIKAVVGDVGIKQYNFIVCFQ